MLFCSFSSYYTPEDTTKEIWESICETVVTFCQFFSKKGNKETF
jgi:hypothetical protein